MTTIKSPAPDAERTAGSLHRDGSAAAPEITHAFNLDLTKKQAKQLREIWREHGGINGMIIMQPVLEWGPFTITNAFAQCAVLNKECTLMIHNAIEQARQPNEEADRSGGK